MALTVLIPVNRLERAKGRLAEVLSAAEREALAVATLLTVYEAARGAGFEPVLLTADPRVSAVLGPGAKVMAEDEALRGLNAQLERAMELLGGDQLLILHADLPLATWEPIARFVAAAAPPPSVTLVRSGDGGTNAMLLRPPGRFALSYGTASHGKHVAAARTTGLAVATVDSPELELDLDTAEDLAALLRTLNGSDTRAGKVLDAAGLREKLSPG